MDRLDASLAEHGAAIAAMPDYCECLRLAVDADGNVVSHLPGSKPTFKRKRLIQVRARACVCCYCGLL